MKVVVCPVAMRPVAGVSLVAAAVMAALAPQAFAQSTGSLAAESALQEVLVTSRRIPSIGGIITQDIAKSRISISSEVLNRVSPGQSAIEALNQVPGLNFTNNDPYGTSGGNIRLRSFDGSRVSLTFDGIPVNDTGNYASFTNQLPDGELIDRVDVNLGTTDVDSPTASATGGTIAWRTRKPASEMGGLAVLSTGQFSYRRAFGRFDTGAVGPFGTTAFISASTTQYDKFRGPGSLEKLQINGQIRQDFSNGDFISLSVHGNRNRNAQYRSASEASFAQFGREYDNLATCTRPTPTKGVADNDGATPVASTPQLPSSDNPLNPSACSNYYGVRINPSDTGNIRINSLWHLTDNLRLTVDPSVQYTLANGGGSTLISDTPVANNADRRIVGNTALAGFDINGDGDILDTVRLYTPNNTNTQRYGINSNLIWDFLSGQQLRAAYTMDYGRHTQTAAWGYLDANGNPLDVFAGRQGSTVPTADGSFLRGRDRYSEAKLNQLAFEWRGKFADNKLNATVGVRLPNLTRNLNQYCYTPNGGTGNSGGALCTTQVPVAVRPNGNVVFINSATAVEYIAPYSETVKFNAVLPNVGLSYAVAEQQLVYVSYAGGLSAPRTDNLYSVRRQPDNSVGRPTPESEKTQSYDLGWRYTGSTLAAQVALWKSDYQNRIASAYDADLGFNVDRNLGDVALQGAELQLGRTPIADLTLNASAAFTSTELLQDTPSSSTTVILTKGKKLVETPDYTFGVRAEYRVLSALRVGLQGKYVGKRYSSDVNDYYAAPYKVFDLDARYALEFSKLKQVELQLNVINLFDEQYFGSISSSTGGTALPFYQLGSPRTAMMSLRVAF